MKMFFKHIEKSLTGHILLSGILFFLTSTLLFAFVAFSCHPKEETQNLLQELLEIQAIECHGIQTDIIKEKETISLLLNVTEKERFNWINIPASGKEWDLSQAAFVDIKVANTGGHRIKILAYVLGNKGWDAVGDTATLLSGETRNLRCKLRETYGDGTPKLDPHSIKSFRIVLDRPSINSKLKIEDINLSGNAETWITPEDRLNVPEMTKEKPAPGKRVLFQPQSVIGTKKYVALYLPTDWKEGRKYPIIVEFPGNQWYTCDCYSTGKPEQCTIGYGMSKGKGTIWVSMPFVDNALQDISIDGWGNPDHTAAFTLETLKEIISKFGGDEGKCILTGFSRGAIACGFIGLRAPELAAYWKGIHACQHFDGDGWHGADMAGAKERIKNFRGSYFHTDNNGDQPKQMLMEAKVESNFTSSGLGAHATAMFLDERESSQQLREWYREIIK